MFNRGVKSAKVGPYVTPEDTKGSLLHDDPLSSHFVATLNNQIIGDKPQDLALYLIALQRRRFGTSISNNKFNLKVLTRQASLLLDNYDADIIKRTIRIGITWSQFPFTFAYVKRTIPKVVEKCPFMEQQT